MSWSFVCFPIMCLCVCVLGKLQTWIWSSAGLENLVPASSSTGLFLLPSLDSLRNGKPLITQALILSSQLNCPFAPPPPLLGTPPWPLPLPSTDIGPLGHPLPSTCCPLVEALRSSKMFKWEPPGVGRSELASPLGDIHRPQLWKESLGRPQAYGTLRAHDFYSEQNFRKTLASIYGFPLLTPRFQKSIWQRLSLGYFYFLDPSLSPVTYPNPTSCRRSRFLPTSPNLWIF